MKLKINLFLIAWMFISNGFSQQSLEQKDSIAKNISPIQNKAIVFVIRPTAFAFAIRMDVSCDTTYIGTTGPKSFLYTVLSPGSYTFLSRSENNAFLEVTFEAGKIYYLEQEVKMGMIYARTKLKLVEEEKGRKFLSKSKLDHSNQYSR
jgi:hypothetical protein